MKIILLLALSGLLLAACDKEVSRETHPDEAFLAKSLQSCSKGMGYCFGCGYHIGKGYRCGVGLMLHCPGSQPTTVRRTPVDSHRESGKIEHLFDEETVSVDGACS